MDRLAWNCWYQSARVRWLAPGLCAAGLALAGPGCTHLKTPSPIVQGPSQPRLLTVADDRRFSRPGLAFSPDDAEPAAAAEGRIRLASATTVDRLPATLPATVPSRPIKVGAAPAAGQSSEPAAEMLTPPTPLPGEQAAASQPIGLDTVFRLAEEQNPQIALARERVREAYAEKDVAQSKWLPDVYVGTAYYRHEGGIANEDGTLTHSSYGSMFAGMELNSAVDVRDIAYQQVNAKRKVWQQKGELSRVTSETLLDASNTYIDWLTARTGEAIAREMMADLRDLLGRARDLAKVDKGVQVEVSRLEAELDA
ncbi:MAG TPA: TolC family protein, partial [Gemmataceae bacterium]|nr:TolC family protein [Gemmataceae bacterium]